MKKNILDNPGELGQSIELRKVDKKIASFDEAARYRQVTVVDKNGEIISDSTRRVVRANGSGFVISYTERMSDFLCKCSTGAIVRVFVFLAHHQNYGTDGKTFGYRCSHKYLQTVLHIEKPTLWRALHYLKEHLLVHVGKIEGFTEFMVNPYYVTIGTDRKARIREWERRWSDTLKKEGGKLGKG